jgi:hypothetical protein
MGMRLNYYELVRAPHCQPYSSWSGAMNKLLCQCCAVVLCCHSAASYIYVQIDVFRQLLSAVQYLLLCAYNVTTVTSLQARSSVLQLHFLMLCFHGTDIDLVLLGCRSSGVKCMQIDVFHQLLSAVQYLHVVVLFHGCFLWHQC